VPVVERYPLTGIALVGVRSSPLIKVYRQAEHGVQDRLKKTSRVNVFHSVGAEDGGKAILCPYIVRWNFSRHIDQPWKITSIAQRDWAAIGHSL
jgi:hypothetical protein